MSTYSGNQLYRNVYEQKRKQTKEEETKERGRPCMRLVRKKFELTYKDSAGGKRLYGPDVNVR